MTQYPLFMKVLLIRMSGRKSKFLWRRKNSVTKEALEGVVFGLYAGEDIKNMQGKVVVEKDTLLETKATLGIVLARVHLKCFWNFLCGCSSMVEH